MLTVTVKEGGYVLIGEDIIVKYISGVKNGYISMGIEAPKELRISRGELHVKELEEKVSADLAAPEELAKAKAIQGKYKKSRESANPKEIKDHQFVNMPG